MSPRRPDSTHDALRGGRVRVPRSRGATSGTLLAALGAWGALIPFIGPLFHFGFTPNTSWHWTSARGWLEVLPGVVVVLGALLLLLSTDRITASLGGWLAVAGGAWFIVGTDFADLFGIGSVGSPRGSGKGIRLLETLAFFDGLGAVILFLAAGAVGRLSVRSVRDVRAAQRREDKAEREQESAASARRPQGEQDADAQIAAQPVDTDQPPAVTQPIGNHYADARPSEPGTGATAADRRA